MFSCCSGKEGATDEHETLLGPGENLRSFYGSPSPATYHKLNTSDPVRYDGGGATTDAMIDALEAAAEAEERAAAAAEAGAAGAIRYRQSGGDHSLRQIDPKQLRVEGVPLHAGANGRPVMILQRTFVY